MAGPNKPTAADKKKLAESKVKLAAAEKQGKIEREEIARIKAIKEEVKAKWDAGYRNYVVLHKNVTRMTHPSQNIMITSVPTELKLDNWIESQLKAGLIQEV
jgi:hypothetical protein